MEKKISLAGLFIMIGLIVVGLNIPAAVDSLKSYDRTVEVKGLCEREVEADKVIWPITFTKVGNDLTQVYNEVEDGIAIIRNFLVEGGIPEGEINVSIPSISDKYAQEYGVNDRPYRYLAKTVVTACTGDVAKVRELMSRQSDLFKKGLVLTDNSWENQVQFRFEGLNEIKPAMIEEATGNAREAAEKFASDSGSRIGKIKTARQGTFSIEDRDSNTPYIKKVRVVTSLTYYLKK